jgi:hypothetical protein
MDINTAQLWELAEYGKISDGQAYLYVDEDKNYEYKIVYDAFFGKFHAFLDESPARMDMCVRDRWLPIKKTMTKEEAERILDVKII